MDGVFFCPFAFPILTRLLRVLFQSNVALFAGCTLASLAVFGIIYVVIYGLTAKAYYQIVK